MPKPPSFFSDPETADPSSGGGSKIIDMREEEVKPKGNSFSDEEGADPQSGSGTAKTDRVEPVKPKGKS